MNLRQLVERSDRVFPPHPQVGRYFPSSSADAARRRLVRSIDRGDGPGVVIGPAGSGKSLILQLLAASFHSQFDVVLLACSPLQTRRALLQAIHFELGLGYDSRDEGQLRLSLLNQLLGADQASDGLLLLVDEAQALPAALIEELRVLTNLVRDGAPRVRLVLAGLPSLEEKLASPELASFSQRLAARCYLGSLSRDETAQYVRAQLAASAVDPDAVIATDAYNALFDATDGVPRLVNQLCDLSLLHAVEAQRSQIDREVVQAAWAELQQLPMPSNMTSDIAAPAAGGAGVIEFGALDDAEPSPAVPPVEQPSAEPPPVEAPAAVAEQEFEVIDPTELDEEEASASPPAASRRPQVFAGTAPDAVDPFADQFAEEELVLESYANLTQLFHAQTPQVENRRNPAFAEMVEEALRTSEKSPAEQLKPDAEISQPGEAMPVPPSSTIRLALVAESTLDDAEMVVADAEPEAAPAEYVDPPAAVDDEPVLVIEDEAAVAADAATGEPGVRRENYRNLFSRLRHGT